MWVEGRRGFKVMVWALGVACRRCLVPATVSRSPRRRQRHRGMRSLCCCRCPCRGSKIFGSHYIGTWVLGSRLESHTCLSPLQEAAGARRLEGMAPFGHRIPGSLASLVNPPVSHFYQPHGLQRPLGFQTVLYPNGVSAPRKSPNGIPAIAA